MVSGLGLQTLSNVSIHTDSRVHTHTTVYNTQTTLACQRTEKALNFSPHIVIITFGLNKSVVVVVVHFSAPSCFSVASVEGVTEIYFSCR